MPLPGRQHVSRARCGHWAPWAFVGVPRLCLTPFRGQIHTDNPSAGKRDQSWCCANSWVYAVQVGSYVNGMVPKSCELYDRHVLLSYRIIFSASFCALEPD